MNDANEPTRVLIADDHPVMRDGLRDMVEQQPDMEVVGEATNGIEAIAEYRRIKPDVILMDLQMPELDGLEAISVICRPPASAAIIVLTTYPGDVHASRAISAGATSYLLKTATRKEIIAAIRGARLGHGTIAPEMSQEGARCGCENLLSDREISVLKLISQGIRNRKISDLLHVSEEAIKTRIKRILCKLHARDRSHAVSIALSRGYFDL